MKRYFKVTMELYIPMKDGETMDSMNKDLVDRVEKVSESEFSICSGMVVDEDGNPIDE